MIGQKRTRSERVAALELPPGQWERAWAGLRRRDVLGRIGLALLAAATMSVVIRAWEPPFAFRSGFVPLRDVDARIAFTDVDVGATEAARERARNEVPYVYVNDPSRLEEIRVALFDTVVALATAQTLADFGLERWQEFHPPPAKDPQQPFQDFRASFVTAGKVDKEKLDHLEKALAVAFLPFEQRGILHQLPPRDRKGNQEEILLRPKDKDLLEPPPRVKLSEVLIGDGTPLYESLRAQVAPAEVANRLFAWIQPKLREADTLTVDETVDVAAQMEQAAAAVEPVLMHYEAGQTLAKAGRPIDEQRLHVLRLEHQAALSQRAITERVLRFSVVMLVIFAMFMLCGMYMRYRQRGPLASVTRLNVMLALAIIAVALGRWATDDVLRAELVPLLLFGMTMAIAYRQELALLLSGVVTLILVLGIGRGLFEFLLLMSVITAAVLNLGSLRSRSKLIYVGLFAGGVALVLDVALALIDNQPLRVSLLIGGLRSAAWVLFAACVMSALLPFIERLFGVLTDLSLLELGDVAHPLLQELVRRAPSTYNHSITVGSIAEAAAESIGVRGLLVRVGAYFHDIGKMLKPGYFIENQRPDENRHESLLPAMSSLVIVAHIKDGADLARQHHLPQPIIDLIEQHHGTTRVGFFYERATEQKESDPNGGEVDETIYRYPGPKPQTKEAGVLMLADNVESASRTLVDPTPARIESLVREVAERRLHGGQFDESGLTLRELRTIEKSLVKSLTAIYHGRIKYPEPKTA